MENLINELQELSATLKADGYKNWSYAQLTINKAINILKKRVKNCETCDIWDICDAKRINECNNICGLCGEKGRVKQMKNGHKHCTNCGNYWY